MDAFTLTVWQRRRLERQLRQADDVPLYRRTAALLDLARGRSAAEVARTLGVSRQSIYNWVAAYAAEHDPRALADADRSGRPSVWSDQLRAALRDGLGRPPDRLGYPAVGWTVPLLREHLQRWGGQRPSDRTVRRELRRLGYVWKRFRYVLDPDPQREKKTRHPPAGPRARGSARPAG
jgi:transposase